MLRLGAIPEVQYADYRYEVIFNAYKWDPQVGDHNTVAQNAVLMERSAALQLEQWAEQLSEETMRIEEALAKELRKRQPTGFTKRFTARHTISGALGLPDRIARLAGRLEDYDRSRNVRLMRFDFHPTADGWALSEVNSDVPGGLAEASLLPGLAGRFFNGYKPRGDTADALLNAFRRLIAPGGTIALIHATSYSDDRQVMQFLGDAFTKGGYRAIYSAPDNINWRFRKPEGVDGIIRFFPVEWLCNLPAKCAWTNYFDCAAPSCNHPIAILAQSKRLPLVWDELADLSFELSSKRSSALSLDLSSELSTELSIERTTEHSSEQSSEFSANHSSERSVKHSAKRSAHLPAWKLLLPLTVDPRTIKYDDGGWIYKPALGRVGEGISVRGATSENEYRQILRAVKKSPGDWVGQRMFHSRPLEAENGDLFHLCVGVFTVQGKSAGFYGRVSPYPRIDDRAQDIAVLIGD